MAEQGSMFEPGDALGDALTYRTEDGAQVTAPSLFQQGDAPTAAQVDADRTAAAFVDDHRATIAANSDHRVTITAVRNYVLAACPCGWARQVFSLPTAQRFGRAHELNSAATPAELEQVKRRHRAQRAAAAAGSVDLTTAPAPISEDPNQTGRSNTA